MSRNRKWLSLLCGGAIAALSCAPALSLSGSAAPGSQAIASKLLPGHSAARAAVDFVKALAGSDAQSVWMFASEEEQDAFQTEDAALAAYADEFPLLTRAERVSLERTWDEGETPFVALTVTDRGGERYRATLGFWLDDAGDWKLVSAEVAPLDARVATR